MSSLFSNSIFVVLLLLTSVIDLTLNSCEPDTVGTCGCCKNSTTECVVVPSNLLLSVPFYDNYICVPKFLAENFSWNRCNCTSKEANLCICSNKYSKVYPVYSSCSSFTECLMDDIKARAQKKIRGKQKFSMKIFI